MIVRRLSARLLLALLFAALVSAAPAAAQVEELEYGASVVGTLEAGGTPAQYTLMGAEGDLVTLQVIGITPELHPSLLLISPGQTQVITASLDSLNPQSSTATLAYRLSETGMYLILIGSRDQTSGDFVLTVQRRSIEQAAALSPGILAQVDIQPGAQPRVFIFELAPTAPTVLTITNETPDFSFAAEVRDHLGQVVSRLDRVVQSTRLEFAPGDDLLYQLTIAAASADMGGTITLSLSNQPATAPPPEMTGEVSAPDAFPTVTASAAPVLIGTPTSLSPDSPSPFGLQTGGDSANPTPTFTPLSPNLPAGTPNPNITPTQTFTPIPRELLPATVVLPTNAPRTPTRPASQPANTGGGGGGGTPNWDGARTNGDGGCINSADFILDVTIPDGTVVRQGEPFVKTWRLQNTGTCAWDSRYAFVKTSGSLVSGFINDTVAMPATAPGATVDLSIVLAALTSASEQRANFQIRDANGFFFGPQAFVLVNVQP